LTLTETVGNATVLAPDQLTAKRDGLVAGESVLHLYRVKVAPTVGAGEPVSLRGTVSLGGVADALVLPQSSVIIAAEGGEQRSREIFVQEAWLQKYDNAGVGDQCVVLASISLAAAGDSGFTISAVNEEVIPRLCRGTRRV